jgi:adenine-specific DNA-methyltransferase
MSKRNIETSIEGTADMTQPENFDLRSQDVASDKVAELLRLFPEIRTEGGRLDFDRLKLTLGQSVDVGKERFGTSWPGKAECFKTIQAPSLGTLRPCLKKSINFDTTENLIIEGDNLEVLKLLQKSYLGQVKMIYIDPPYNTGKDFIYPDNYTESLQTYLQYTGQVDAEGRKFGTNTDTDGRFHSKWLSMMYPRLFLAKNLLRRDGVIFISIDEHEVANLKKLCDEIYGEENFCCQFVWHTEGNTDNQYSIKVVHEYILCYYRDYTMADRAIGRVVDPNTPEASNLWKGIADNNINKNSPANPPDIIELPIGFPCAEESLTYKRKEVDEEFFKVTRHEKYISDEIQHAYGIEKKSGLPVKLDDLVVKAHKLVQPCRIYGGFANRNKLIQFIENGCQPIIDDGTPLTFYLNSNAAVRYQREEHGDCLRLPEASWANSVSPKDWLRGRWYHSGLLCRFGHDGRGLFVGEFRIKIEAQVYSGPAARARRGNITTEPDGYMRWACWRGVETTRSEAS